MNSKFFVSYEAAKLLKEKGYKEFYSAYYWDNELKIGGFRGLEWYNVKDFFPAPTKAEAIDWLESRGIVVEALYAYLEDTYFYTVYYNNQEIDAPPSHRDSSRSYKTRLKAEDAAIIKALEIISEKGE